MTEKKLADGEVHSEAPEANGDKRPNRGHMSNITSAQLCQNGGGERPVAAYCRCREVFIGAGQSDVEGQDLVRVPGAGEFF